MDFTSIHAAEGCRKSALKAYSLLLMAIRRYSGLIILNVDFSKGYSSADSSGLYTENGLNGMLETETLTSWILCSHSWRL